MHAIYIAGLVGFTLCVLGCICFDIGRPRTHRAGWICIAAGLAIPLVVVAVYVLREMVGV